MVELWIRSRPDEAAVHRDSHNDGGEKAWRARPPPLGWDAMMGVNNDPGNYACADGMSRRRRPYVAG